MNEILTFWSVLAVIGIAASALYSGLETGAYSLNRVRLQIRDHHREPAARTLRKLLANPTLLLSTLLIGNNLANQIGVSSLAVILNTAGFNPWQTILLNTLIIAPLLFIFGETLPKDTFAAYCDRLMYRLSPVLTGSRWLFTITGLVPVVTTFSWLAMKLTGGSGQFAPSHPRRQVELLVQEGVGHGLLSDDQSDIVTRVLGMGGSTARDVMVPWHRVHKLRVYQPATVIWKRGGISPHSRLPVINRAGVVVGVIDVLDVLLRDPGNRPSLGKLVAPAIRISASMPLRAALQEVRRSRVALAIVTGHHNEPIGIVTVKDLIEPITGKLADW